MPTPVPSKRGIALSVTGTVAGDTYSPLGGDTPLRLVMVVAISVDFCVLGDLRAQRALRRLAHRAR